MMFGSITEIGILFDDLCDQHSHWSQQTFGSDAERGPIGPLKHLEKEAREAQANPTDSSEYADCLLLTLDAARRAGISGPKLLQAAMAKLKVNRARTWPKPSPDSPVEHIRESEPA